MKKLGKLRLTQACDATNLLHFSSVNVELSRGHARLKPGATVPEMFSDDRTLLGIDGITFIGDTLYENNVIFNKLYRVPMDAGGKAGRPVDIRLDKAIKCPDGMRAANGKLFLSENEAGKIDMVTVSGDTATVTTLKEGLATPTAIEPAGGALWYNELEADRAHSMPLPNLSPIGTSRC